MKAADFIARHWKIWGGLGLYAKFEHVVAAVLVVMISALIVAAMLSLALDVARLLAGGLDALKDAGIEEIFGRIMTVLIALEFNLSIAQVLEHHGHLVQVRTVVLVAILAVARKFIIIDLEAMSWEALIALAVVIAALGATYWVLAATVRKQQAGPGRHGEN